jgi:hypothetical protein
MKKRRRPDCSNLQKVHRCERGQRRRAQVVPFEDQQQPPLYIVFNNDPSAGSPTETLLRLLLPLNDQV